MALDATTLADRLTVLSLSLVYRGTAIPVACGGRDASGKSILDLTTLAAQCGSRLELEADGPDAEAALDALTGWVARRFDERE